jgi:Apea-like HEPN
MVKDRNSERRDALIKRTAETLASMHVAPELYLPYDSVQLLLALDASFADKKNPSPQRKLAERHISATPIADFMLEAILETIRERTPSDREGAEWRLDQFPGFSDIPSAAERLVDGFFRIPYEYQITIPLNEDVAILVQILSAIEWQEKFQFVVFDEAFKVTHPLPTYATEGSTILGGLLNWSWPSSGGISFRTNGYVGKTKSFAPQIETFERLQAILGIAWAYQLVDFNSRVQAISQFPFSQHEGRYAIHRHENNELIFDSFGSVTPGILRILRQINFEKPLISTNPDQLHEKVTKFGGLLRDTFVQSVDAGNRLIRGAKWLCDSLCAEDETLAFVQATIAMEILLSEKNDKGNKDLSLGAIYKNRCAYALGANHQERDELMSQVAEIYEIRSNIVHSGFQVLSNREISLLITLRILVARLLHKEVRMIWSAS